MAGWQNIKLASRTNDNKIENYEANTKGVQ